MAPALRRHTDAVRSRWAYQVIAIALDTPRGGAAAIEKYISGRNSDELRDLVVELARVYASDSVLLAHDISDDDSGVEPIQRVKAIVAEQIAYHTGAMNVASSWRADMWTCPK
jgi:hypothetical protein